MRMLLLLSGLLAAGCFAAGENSAIDITAVHAWNQADQGYFADLDVTYRLSDVVIEALDQGVPLVFILTLNIRHEHAFWFDHGRQLQRIFRARYRPLSNSYQVETFANANTEPTASPQRFVTKHALFSYLGELREIPIASSDELLAGHRYILSADIRLDIASLPLPMRPRAYLSTQWQQHSGWSEWPLNQ